VKDDSLDFRSLASPAIDVFDKFHQSFLVFFLSHTCPCVSADLSNVVKRLGRGLLLKEKLDDQFNNDHNEVDNVD